MSWPNENPDALRASGARRIPITINSSGNRYGMLAGSTGAIWLWEGQHRAQLSGHGMVFHLNSTAAVAAFAVAKLNATTP
jgi:hypothetical protein